MGGDEERESWSMGGEKREVMRTAWREAFAMSDGGGRARSGLRSHVALSKV